MENFILGKSYHYNAIKEEATEDIWCEESGEECSLGESFIVLKDLNTQTVTSFVMNGYNPVYGAYYKCIYKDNGGQ